MRKNFKANDIFISALLAGNDSEQRRVMIARCDENTLDDACCDFLEKIMLQCEEDNAHVTDMQIIRSKEALDKIKLLTAENERLNTELKNLTSEKENLISDLTSAKAEIKRLNAEVRGYESMYNRQNIDNILKELSGEQNVKE